MLAIVLLHYFNNCLLLLVYVQSIIVPPLNILRVRLDSLYLSYSPTEFDYAVLHILSFPS